MDKTDPRTVAVLTLGTILQMSDEAQKLGGAASIAGVASLHRLQTSIQKNRARIIEMVGIEMAEVGEPS